VLSRPRSSLFLVCLLLSAVSKKDAKEVTTTLLLRTLLSFLVYVCPRTGHISSSVLIPLLFIASYLSRDKFERHCAYTHVPIQMVAQYWRLAGFSTEEQLGRGVRFMCMDGVKVTRRGRVSVLH
jgi:hypothetical protein